MGDTIQHLKTDSIPIDSKERDILQRYFPEQYSKITRNEQMILQFQNIFYLGLLFFLLNYSVTEKTIQSILPITNKNPLLFLLLKTFLFILLLWLLLNLSHFLPK